MTPERLHAIEQRADNAYGNHFYRIVKEDLPECIAEIKRLQLLVTYVGDAPSQIPWSQVQQTYADAIIKLGDENTQLRERLRCLGEAVTSGLDDVKQLVNNELQQYGM